MTVTEYSGPGSPRLLVSPGPGSRAGSQHRSFRLDLSRQAPFKMVRRAGTLASLRLCVKWAAQAPSIQSGLHCCVALGACTGTVFSESEQ